MTLLTWGNSKVILRAPDQKERKMAETYDLPEPSAYDILMEQYMKLLEKHAAALQELLEAERTLAMERSA